ncbi:MAG TPA: permease-like cell division protein FtsX [Candidatus Saccharimonadales bacterium]|nr:permease-like cell division protein FtsX [Candidatus Saccharimonadales bacterium]
MQRNISKIYLGGISILLLGIVILGSLIFFKKQIIQKNYCTFEETKLHTAHPTKEQLKKYLDCRSITIFLKSDTPQNQITLFQKEFSAIKGVYRVDYISQEQALALYRKQNKNNPLLLELVTKDILPASFEIYIVTPQLKASALTAAKNVPNRQFIDVVVGQ